MTTAILDVRPATRPGIVHDKEATADLVRLFALDRVSGSRRPLICHWQRERDGRLVCIWEPDVPAVPHR